MTWFRVLTSRLSALFTKRRADRDLSDEIQAHLDALIEEHVRGGMTRADAIAAARREFGGVEQIKETYRDQRGWPLLDALAQDLRYAFLAFRKNRGFAAIVILTFALGIGANTAVFTFIDALLLRWLPVRDPKQLVQLFVLRQDEPPGTSFSYPLVQALSARSTVFSGLFGASNATFMVGPLDARERTRGAWVTGSYYQTLGLQPAVGRLLTPDDDRPDAPPAAVITDAYWARKFARDPRITGATMLIEGVPVTIVGVSPPSFVGIDVGFVADVTLAIAVVPQIVPDQASRLDADSRWLRVFARPLVGIARPQVRAGLAVVWPRLVNDTVAASRVETRRRWVGSTLDLVEGGTGWTFLRQQFQQPLFVLMALVVLVHLIACTNVANLLLARAAWRRREIAIRLAMGAGRGRIIRQMLTESLVLSLAGAACGAGVAWLIERFLINLLSGAQRTPITLDLTPHWHVLTFTIATATVTGVVFGLAPAFRAATSGSAAALTTGSKVITGSRSRLASGLVVTEVALSLLLIVGAGLFGRTLLNLRQRDAGFRHEGVLLVDVDGPRAGYRDAQLTPFYERLLRDAAQLPGVRSASLSLITPLAGGGISFQMAIDGRPAGETWFNAVTPQYFETLGTPVVAGRDFTTDDNRAAPLVAIVNETFVTRTLSNRDPFAQRVTVRGRQLQIVGVVKDAIYESLREAPPPTVYVPLMQSDRVADVTVVVRARADASSVSGLLRRLLQPQLPGAEVRIRTLSGQVERSLIRERLMATLAGGLGLLALVLASVGVYGVLAYTVARRTNEIGVRMALGAARSQVLWLVVRDAGRLIVLGALVGLPGAWGASRLVSSMLFGLTPTDPVTLVGATAVLGASGLLASLIPACRAAQVDPMEALRHE